ncbi:hypothetical protein DXC54_11385 [Bifidobacterium longum]|uniref:Uncharacterized protein n=1 Tax=Bifidobacterium longum TaxID=216816 RepID=A0A3E4S4Z5_BIFLN|nr:hypothetical protein DXC63_11275 [Bifidobacterium longum]RGL63389.1 hypothetical protein DXC54_11385 [Bifidobacterium longum]RHB62922.1 hypothetical protein DW875_05065 [Bifidobacterium longum]
MVFLFLGKMFHFRVLVFRLLIWQFLPEAVLHWTLPLLMITLILPMLSILFYMVLFAHCLSYFFI